jgi:hypothetical protein
MTNDCPLLYWTTNSRIDHGVSSTVGGPYDFVDVAIPTFAHNPAPVRLFDGTYALFHIGNGAGPVDGGTNCTPVDRENGNDGDGDDGPATKPGRRRRRLQLSHGGSNIHISTSLYGPWVPINHTLGDCNNPSPWVDHNTQTIYVACTDGYIRTASSIYGPYTKRAEFPLSPIPPTGEVTTDDGPDAAPIQYEDPQLYLDRNGYHHILYHAYQRIGPSDRCEDSVVSAHAYSVDGSTWYTSSVPPYGTQLEVYDDETSHEDGNMVGDTDRPPRSTKFMTLASRERPKPFFNTDGQMTHIVEGVCGSPNCVTTDGMLPFCVHCKYRQWDFTLISPLSVGTP